MYRFIDNTLPTGGLEEYDRDAARVMTAMTFDAYGEPVDYFKQVFAAFNIAEGLAAGGIDTEVQLLVADNFVHLNQAQLDGGLDPDTIDRCAAGRYATLKTLAALYASDVPVDVQFTSELQDTMYDRIVERLGDRVEQNPLVEKLLLQSVPKHRRDEQSSAREATRYTRGELATIIRSGADIKVGPRRERRYDVALHDSNIRDVVPGDCNEPVGAYVTDTYPTGVAADVLSRLRAENGVLPYKSSSEGVDPNEHRIRLRDDCATIEQKVQQAPSELTADLADVTAYMTGDAEESATSLAQALAAEFERIRDYSDLPVIRACDDSQDGNEADSPLTAQ